MILDIGLPGMDGYAVCEHVRQMPEQDETIMIALSGYGQSENIQHSSEVGFDHHLIKPATLDQINRCMHRTH
jgi:CheY-like chemotaxis protein